MKKSRETRIFILLLCLLMLAGIFPITVFADYEDGEYCEYCGSWRYDDWLCDNGGHCAAGYGCGDDHHCAECGECESNSDFCGDCTRCVDCAIETGYHCWGCGVCCNDVDLCEECGLCYDCGGVCSEGTDHLCLECHLAEEMACPNCGNCYAVSDPVRCLGCEECGFCVSEWCEDCWMCLECAMEYHCHCSECGECQMDTMLCDECGRCYDCGGECSEGTSHLCLQCHLDENLACPNCGKCYVDDDNAQCESCGACADCVGNYCEDCHMCEDCAVDKGKHCPDCGTCTQNEGCLICHRCFDCGGRCNSGCGDACLECHYDYDQACPDCGNCFQEGGYEPCDNCGRCSDCGGGWCDNCRMCLDCVMDNEYHCPLCEECLDDVGEYCENCHACENCAEICPNCGDYCSECSVLCYNCGTCENCADICPNCGDYCSECSAVCNDCGTCENCADICPNCGDYCSECSVLCYSCGTCENCADICPNCGDYCSECGVVCRDCGTCENCADICPECGEMCSECGAICDDCGLCENCCWKNSAAAGCGHGVCIKSGNWISHWQTSHAGQEHTHIYQDEYSADDDNHWKTCKVCGKMTDIGAHKDHLTHVPAKEKTCGEDGNTEYYICKCGMMFEDAAASLEITDHNSVVIPATGHRFGNMTEVPYKEPTCSEDGNKRYYICKTCGHWFINYAGRVIDIDDNRDYVIIPAVGHKADTMIKVPWNNPTCTEKGNSTYYVCPYCDHWFIIYAGRVIDIESYHDYIVFDAAGHDWGEWTETKPATASEEGEETRICKSCWKKERRSTARLGVESYAITVNCGEHGSAYASAGTAEIGANIMIYASPYSGYMIDTIRYTPEGGSATDITNTKRFSMPGKNVSVEVNFKKAPVHAVNVIGGGRAYGDADRKLIITEAAVGETVYVGYNEPPGDKYVSDILYEGVSLDDGGWCDGVTMPDKAITFEIVTSPRKTFFVDMSSGSATIPADVYVYNYPWGSNSYSLPPVVNNIDLDGSGKTDITVTWHGGDPTATAVKHADCDIATFYTLFPPSTNTPFNGTVYKFNDDGTAYYYVMFNVKGHGYTPASQSVQKGETAVEPTPSMVKGWKFGGWYKEPACINAFDFSTPITGNITLYAKWTRDCGSDCPSAHLKDVDKTQWYHDGIDFVVENNLMQGVSADQFAPNATTTRAMIVTILYRLAGKPAVNGTSPFSDVANGQWYTEAVIWANNNGIVSGYGNGKFGPTDNITREQMAAILFRYSKFKGYDTSKTTSLNGFSDSGTISAYAVEAMKWAVAEGLIKGVGDNKIAPTAGATRAQVATIFMRYIENVK